MLGLAALLGALSACGSAGDPSYSGAEIFPASPEVWPGESMRFVASVGGAAVAIAEWSVVESDGGTIDAEGTYTAPDSEGIYTVRAQVKSEGTTETTAVRVKRNVRVAVSPSAATIAPGESVALIATVSGSAKTVTWSVAEGAAGGSVTESGTYTAPQTPGTYTVVATSIADPSKSAAASVTVQQPAPPPPAPTVSVTLSPKEASVYTGDTLQLTATVTGSTDVGVIWSVAEAGGGTVSTTGLYTAPLVIGTYTVVATSRADTSKYAAAVVTVTAAPVSVAPAPTSPTATLPPGVVPAFPGAEGGGAASKGGRGGAVIKVTNLNDSGPGSLRACVTASGPRTCVFTVGGVINVLSTMRITSPYLTIAGQTAPGGIALYTGRASPVNYREAYALSVEAPDVIIRYLRIWGDTVPNQGAPVALGGIAVAVYRPRVIVDHVTALWQTGYSMVANVGGNNNGADLSLQWNLMGENVINTTNYPNGQSTPLLLLSDGSHSGIMWDPYGVTDMDLHHNLIASGDHRLPGMCAERGRVINNAIYNWGRMSYVDTQFSSSMISADFIGNHFKPGPWNGGNGPGGGGYREIMANRGSVTSGTAPSFSLYVSRNQSDWAGWDSWKGDRGTVSASASDTTQWAALTSGSGAYQGAAKSGFVPLPSTYRRSGRLPAPASGIDVTVHDGATLPSLLTAPGGVGASRYLSCTGKWIAFRDSAEARIIANYLNGTGPTRPPTSAAAANGGALPTLGGVAGCADSDGDGMPDAYEAAVGLNPNGGSDGAWVGSDGYTNLERYLNGA